MRGSMPIMTSLGVHIMEAVAQTPTTFRLTPRPYQYEAVAALLAATARKPRHDLRYTSASLRRLAFLGVRNL